MTMRRSVQYVLVVLLVCALAVGLVAHFLASGALGNRQPVGVVTALPRDPGFVLEKAQRQAAVQPAHLLPNTGARLVGQGPDGTVEPAADKGLAATAQPSGVGRTRVQPDKHILFGDLHVHSTYSFDAYNASLPMYRGDGSHPPGDACDFARYCSGLDFWSINDHAEGLTPRQWQQTRDMVRQCNAAAGDPAHPDMVTFLGWEWTQIGNTPQDHYGHKNVVLRDTGEGEVPARPISSREQLFPGGQDPFNMLMRLSLLASARDATQRQRYHDFIRFLQDREELPVCPGGVPVRDLPVNCQESASTPRELFAKLDDWGFPYLAIPHGNSWGFYTPPLSRWDKQLRAHSDPQRHEPLIEVFSGHGNIEQYRDWRAVRLDQDGKAVCPPPTPDYLPECWRAGQIIEQRCLAAGETAAVCDARAAATRANFILTKDSGHWTVQGATVEDWLDAGQCRDCYMPAYNHRPTSSMQYGLAISDFSTRDATQSASSAVPKRFRWGVIGSSDVHTARPGTGFKEFRRRNMTDAMLGLLGPPAFLIEDEPLPEFVSLEEVGFSGPNFARFASFFGTGGLVAVHAAGRDRESIWRALQAREVYGTSGDRILLWFDLLESPAPQAATHAAPAGTLAATSTPDRAMALAGNDTPQALPLRYPMGGAVVRSANPVFEVNALGAFEQKPGCPADSLRALPEDRLRSLCGGECYYPGDARRPIERIEVVRIRPQISPAEDVGSLIEDPWKVFRCPADQLGCQVRFTDPEFDAVRRDTLYYVRALQAPTPTINGDQLRCDVDANGQCVRVDPCHAGEPTAFEDDCLANVAERAWSSPIYVDYARE